MKFNIKHKKRYIFSNRYLWKTEVLKLKFKYPKVIKLRKRSFFLLISISLIFSVGIPFLVEDHVFSRIELVRAQHVDHSPIVINGNSNFINKATAEGWPGNGSSVNPIIISGLNITGTGNLIDIRDVSLSFKINNCLLTGGDYGVYFWRVISGEINFCNFTNNNMGGIYIDIYSRFITITNNYILNSGKNGIHLYTQDQNYIINNTIIHSQDHGIMAESSESNEISGNFISNNDYGIYLFTQSDNNKITNNLISNNSLDGIRINKLSRSNTIEYNNISTNTGYGIYIVRWAPDYYFSYYNIIRYNNFFGNGARDEVNGLYNYYNNFTYNYWDFWVTPDDNLDGLVDNPYTFSNNEDSYPMVLPSHWPVILPSVTYPNGGETISGVERLEWNVASDSWGHEYTYSVYYSTDDGITWNLLASSLTSLFYYWDTTSILLSEDSLIKIAARCSAGLISEDISDTTFTIDNHFVSEPIILYPNGGETLFSGVIQIEWIASTDDLDHDISYSLHYSSNGGNTWVLLASSLSTTNYFWDITSLQDGSNYLIKVVSICFVGNTAEDTSDGTFNVKTSPNIVIVNPTNSTYSSKSVWLDFSISETTFWIGYSLDGSSNVTITGNTSMSSLSEGSHSLIVHANNTIGHMGSSATIWFTVDTTSPSITIISPSNSTYTEDSFWLNFTVDAPTTWISYSLDGQNNVTISSNTSMSSLSDGSHWIVIYARDSAGNERISTPIWFTVDTTSPSITIISPSNSTYTEDSFWLNFTVDAPTTWISYSLDGQNNVTISSNTSMSSLSDGSHWIVIYARDSAGNEGRSTPIWFSVDTISLTSTTPPTSTIPLSSATSTSSTPSYITTTLAPPSTSSNQPSETETSPTWTPIMLLVSFTVIILLRKLKHKNV